VFLQLIAGISHAPYSLIPPYIEDWQMALDPKAYQPVKTYPFTFLDYHRGNGVEDAYIATLNYTFEMLAGFVSALPRPAIVLILGDHQAPRTGSISPAVTDYAVPFHIMSNRGVCGGNGPRWQEGARDARVLARILACLSSKVAHPRRCNDRVTDSWPTGKSRGNAHTSCVVPSCRSRVSSPSRAGCLGLRSRGRSWHPKCHSMRSRCT